MTSNKDHLVHQKTPPNGLLKSEQITEKKKSEKYMEHENMFLSRFWHFSSKGTVMHPRAKDPNHLHHQNRGPRLGLGKF